MKTIYQRFLLFPLTLALLCALAFPVRATSDSGDSGDSGNSGLGEPVTIALNQSALSLEPVGESGTATLTATTTATASEIHWNSTNTNVATVTPIDGYTATVKAVGAGTVEIIAALASGDPATCVVTVSGIALTPAALDLGLTESASLTATAYGAATGVEADAWTWSSDKEDVATVTKSETALQATVQAVSEGRAVITCTNGTYTATCTATVAEKEEAPVEVTLSESALTLSAGRTGAVTATTSAAADKITWATEDEAIAKVDGISGYVATIQGVATGTTTLTARVGSGPVTRCTVTVSGAAFTSESVTVMANHTLEITPLLYGDATTVPISSWAWTSGTPTVATVTPTSNGGQIRGIRTGNSTISVTIGDYTISCLVTVTPDDYAVAVALSEASITMAPGSSSRLRATTVADSADIEWSVENEEITKIASKTGYTVILTAVAPGITTVSAKVGASDPATCNVTVSGITLSKTSLAMTVNGSEPLVLRTYGEATNVPSSNWEWSSSNTGVAIVVQNTSGANIQAVGAGTSTITCTGGGYTVMCQVEVAANEASAIKASLNAGILKFSEILPELRSICQTMTDESLSYITNLSVSTKLGTLYDGYVSEGDTGFGVSSNRNYYATSGAYMISNLTFVPKPDVTGDVRIGYDGFTVNNKTFGGSVVVSVSQDEATLAYASLNGAAIHFRAEDFFNYSMSVNNRSLQYLTFTLPPSRYGTLYYNYVNASVYESVVSGGTRYYRTYNPGIGNIAFVPSPTYSGNFSLSFTGYDTEGISFAGTVRISVNNPNGSDEGESLRERLHYETGPSARVYFDAQDFIDECKDETGYQLVSIKFRKLPDTDHGRFYYNRESRVYAGDSYSVANLSKLNFVAHKNYTGTFTVEFTGTTDRDTTFRSDLTITVSSNGAYLIRMAATGGARTYLSASDFTEMSKAALDRDFHHVSFASLPSTGSLYYENGTTSVTAGAFYYRSGTSQLLSSVNYVAPENYAGTVRIPYTAWDTEGESFKGYLSMIVEAAGTGSASAPSTTYATGGPALALRADDILAPARKEIGEVVTVHLTPPAPSVGKLVLNYLSPGQYSAFDSSKDYSPDTLGQVFFLPKAGYTGVASITYVARNIYNVVYSGILRVQVNPPTNSAYFTDLANRAWAVPAVDFFRYYNILNGTTPTTYEPDGPARRGAFIAVMGRMYGFPNYPGNGGYEDVASDFYYTPYISAARALGVTEAAQYFYPDTAISRQDAAVYLYRCLVRSGQAPNAPISNLARFKDGYLVSYYAMEAMSALVELGVYQGDENGYLNPASTLTRLQMAAILYRAVT